jgi:MFS family permease
MKERCALPGATPTSNATFLGRFGAFSRDARLYLIKVSLLGFTLNGILAVLATLYLLRLGYGPEFIGLVVAIGQLVYSGACLAASAFGTWWGAKRAMVAGICLIIAGYSALTLAGSVDASWRAGWLIGSSLLTQIGNALHGVNSNPYLMGATTPADRHYVFSMQSSVSPLAGFAGSLIGGFLPRLFAALSGQSTDQVLPYRNGLLVGVALMAPVLWVLSRMGEVQVRPARRPPLPPVAGPLASQPRAKRDLTPLLMIGAWSFTSLVRWAGRAPTNTFFTVYLDRALHLSAPQIGAMSAIAKLVAAATALAVPVVVRRWGRVPGVVWGTSGVAVSLLLIAFVPHWAAAGLGYIGFVALLSITSPICSILNQELVPPVWRPTMSGIVSMAIGLATAGMSLGGGYMIVGMGYQSIFLLSAAITLVSAAMFWLFFRIPRGELAKAEVTECNGPTPSH